jgi:hypothetical protein
VFSVKSFYKNNDNLEAVRRELRRHFNLHLHDLIPSAHAIKIWVSNFEETGSSLRRTLIHSPAIFSGVRMVHLPLGGFFLRDKPDSSKLLTHLMACADGMR